MQEVVGPGAGSSVGPAAGVAVGDIVGKGLGACVGTFAGRGVGWGLGPRPVADPPQLHPEQSQLCSVSNKAQSQLPCCDDQ